MEKALILHSLQHSLRISELPIFHNPDMVGGIFKDLRDFKQFRQEIKSH